LVGNCDTPHEGSIDAVMAAHAWHRERFRATRLAGGERIELVDCGTDQPPGLYEIMVEVAAPDGIQSLALELEADDVGAGISECRLAPLAAGPHRWLIEARLPFRTLWLLAAGTAEAAIRVATLRRVRPATLVGRALVRDPRTTASALLWRLAGKRVRARNRLQRVLKPLHVESYHTWRTAIAASSARLRLGLPPPLADASDAPRMAVLVATGTGRLLAEATRVSLAAQVLAPVAVGVLADGASPAVLPDADWLVVIANGHALAPEALLRLAEAARAHPDAAALYWDSDHVDAGGRYLAPSLRPAWNPWWFLATDYVGPRAFSRAALTLLAAKLAPARTTPLWADRALWAIGETMGAAAICHVPAVLSHAPAAERIGWPPAALLEARRQMVEGLIRERDAGATARLAADGTIRIGWRFVDPPPLVSVVVPTRDRLDLLRPCIETLLRQTDYPALEVLIADNGSRQPATRAYLGEVVRDPRVRIVDCPGRFNFAHINNQAIAAARGRLIACLNNDIEVIEPGWLREMAGWALRPDVGAVGAKLLYPGGSIQHAGVVVGLGGIAGHIHRFFPADHPGQLGRLRVAHQATAVTAAALVVEREKLLAVGGFDAEAFAVALNDVDLCLRLAAKGYATVWTPHAVLLHKESASRARDGSAERREAYGREVAAFKARWSALIARDPTYNPGLTREDESADLLRLGEDDD
jgi:GT2 family glycosyltransferase